MEHIRIRKFNTKDTYPEQNLDNDLCHAVVTEGGKIVWLRGQCPQNLDDGVNIEDIDLLTIQFFLPLLPQHDISRYPNFVLDMYLLY